MDEKKQYLDQCEEELYQSCNKAMKKFEQETGLTITQIVCEPRGKIESDWRILRYEFKIKI